MEVSGGGGVRGRGVWWWGIWVEGGRVRGRDE